jgi:hypothetical protein
MSMLSINFKNHVDCFNEIMKMTFNNCFPKAESDDNAEQTKHLMP